MIKSEVQAFIREYSCLTNLNEYVKNKKINNLINENIMVRLIKILFRYKKSNALLIGEAGIGKTAIVECLADLINKGDVPDFLKDKIIIELSLAGAVAGTKYRGEFEEKITDILNFIKNRDDVILFIDEIHNLVNVGGVEGMICVGDIFKPFLARCGINVIGATTIDEYKKTIKRDKAINRRFTIVKVDEPNVSDTIAILKKVKGDYEKHYKISLTDREIMSIVYNAKYKKGRYPDKALDELENYCLKLIEI